MGPWNTRTPLDFGWRILWILSVSELIKVHDWSYSSILWPWIFSTARIANGPRIPWSEQRKADNEFLFPSHPYFIWFLNSKNSKFFEILAILSFLTFDIKMKGLGECFDLGWIFWIRCTSSLFAFQNINFQSIQTKLKPNSHHRTIGHSFYIHLTLEERCQLLFLNILRKFSSEYFKFSITNDEFKYAVVPVLVQSCLKCAYFVSRFSQCECLLSRPGRDLGVVTTS